MIENVGENIAGQNPHFKDVGYFFKEYLTRYITPDSRLLDIGCGHQAFAQEFYETAKWRVGVDVDRASLAANKIMDEKYPGTIEELPDSLEKFDVIIGQWILEHLENPDAVVRRISGLGKPGSYFIFMTTNIYSPMVLLAKLTPTFLKKILKKFFLNIPLEDTYPAPYRINSVGKIDKHFTKHGFEKVEVKTVGVLTYFAFNRYVLRTKIFLDKILDRFSFTKIFNTHLVGVYRKK